MARDGNLGSVVKLEYITPDDVAVWPDVLPDHSLDGLVQLNSGTDWTDIDINRFSAALSASFSPNGGDAYDVQIPLVRSEMSAENHQAFHQLRHKKLILKVTDGNGKVYLVGSPSFPAFFRFNAATGKNSADFNGYTASISTTLDRMPPEYETNTITSGLSLSGSLLTFGGLYLVNT